MLSLIGVGSAVVSLGAAIWMIAYRIGFREGRESVPLRMIAALAAHRVTCEGHPPEQVVRELSTGLCLADRDARRVVNEVRTERPTLPVPELRTAS